jgi:hypothetical protein
MYFLPSLPPNLAVLDISYTSISSISSLPNSLIQLDAKNTLISELPIFGSFIINLDISHCFISQNTADSIIQNMYIIANSTNIAGTITIQHQHNNNSQPIFLNIARNSNWTGLVSNGWTIN